MTEHDFDKGDDRQWVLTGDMLDPNPGIIYSGPALTEDDMILVVPATAAIGDLLTARARLLDQAEKRADDEDDQRGGIPNVRPLGHLPDEPHGCRD